MAVDEFLINMSGDLGQLGNINHAYSYGMAMAPAVVFKVLNGMTESVAIVQDLTEARFLQILSDNAVSYTHLTLPTSLRVDLGGRRFN